jgi:hypothetical protein
VAKGLVIRVQKRLIFSWSCNFKKKMENVFPQSRKNCNAAALTFFFPASVFPEEGEIVTLQKTIWFMSVNGENHRAGWF